MSHVASGRCLSCNSMAYSCTGRPTPTPVARTPRRPGRAVAARALRPDETSEQALERRMRESARVDERVEYITDSAAFDAQLAAAGGALVVLEVHSDRVCQTGWEEEAELQWKADREAALEPCAALKHTFVRTARDCPDVRFLAVDADDASAGALCDRLGVEVLPTLQFWREGRKLWEHRGVAQAGQDLGEGVLYFGDTAANNEKASAHVRDLRSRADLEAFVAAADDRVLTVVDVSLSDAAPCVHIFPAVLALARNFVGYAAFARLMGDASEETRALLAELRVVEVPTFLFYRGGKEVGRHVGSSRGDLIGQILAQQSAAGVAPPPPAGGGAPRRRAAPPPAAPAASSPASRWR